MDSTGVCASSGCGSNQGEEQICNLLMLMPAMFMLMIYIILQL